MTATVTTEGWSEADKLKLAKLNQEAVSLEAEAARLTKLAEVKERLAATKAEIAEVGRG